MNKKEKLELAEINDIIEQNSHELNDSELLSDFVDAYLYSDTPLEDIEDNINEFIDGYIPVYNSDIVKEWQETPEAQEKTLEVEGAYPEKEGIYKLMAIDLYYYHEERLREDYNNLLQWMSENNEN